MDPSPTEIVYDNKIESALGQIEEHLSGDYEISKRMIGLLLLQDDQDTHELAKEAEGEEYEIIQSIIEDAKSGYSHSFDYHVKAISGTQTHQGCHQRT